MACSAKRKITQSPSEASTERQGPQALYIVISYFFFFPVSGLSGPWLFFFFLEKPPKASRCPVTPTAEQISKRRAIRRYGQRKEQGLVSLTKLPVVQSAKSHNHQAKQVLCGYLASFKSKKVANPGPTKIRKTYTLEAENLLIL